MAAYEVLLLNTAIPQIQAAQSGDTYVVPRDIAINATAIISANSATDALRITQTGTGNALLVEDSANPDSSPFVVTAAGDVGIGTSSPGYKLDVASSVIRLNNSGATADIFLTDSGTTNGYVRLRGESNALKFITGNGISATLDASGNLGLGVTPSAKLEIYSTNNAFNALQVRYNGSNDAMGFGIGNSNGFPYLGYNTKSQAFVDAPVYERSNPAAQLRMDNGSFKFNIAPSGTANTTTITNLVSYTIITSGNQTDFGAANNNVGTVFTANASGTLSSGTVSQNISFTQAMTLDASGRLGVGATNPDSMVEINSATAAHARFKINYNSSALAYFGSYSGIVGSGSATDTMLSSQAVLAFGSGGTTERARITSGGYFKASDNGAYNGATGTYHELRNTANSEILFGTNTNASPFGVTLKYTAASPNGIGNSFLYCEDNVALRAAIRSNGGLVNYQANDANLSDQRTKKDIVAAPSYWDKIKGIEIVHFKYKDQTHDDNNVGVIAQQVEQVAPEFVDQDGWGETPEDGVPLKSIYTSDMYHAAIKALQEAMARIEQLEAKVAAMGA